MILGKFEDPRFCQKDFAGGEGLCFNCFTTDLFF